MPRPLPELLVRRVVVGGYDAATWLRDLVLWHLRRFRPAAVHRQPGGHLPEGPVRRIAVVSAFPSAGSAPFTANLLGLLASRDFHTILVSTRPLETAERVLFAPLVAEMVERPNAGRDFGSYQWALRDLDARPGLLAEAEHLLLANDSLFYPRGFGAELDRMLCSPAPWQGLFEIQEIHYHLGSFFQLFRRSVFAGDAFRRFWARYRAHDARRHVVDQGEVGLSGALRATGLLPEVAYTSPRLVEAIRARGLRVDWLPSGGFPGLRRQDVLERLWHAAPDAVGEHLPAILEFALSAELVHAFEAQNPVQVGGLLCNVLFEAPLKRDLAYRGICDMQQLVTVSEGFSLAERAAMLHDLRRRGVVSGLPPLRRILAEAGRL